MRTGGRPCFTLNRLFGFGIFVMSFFVGTVYFKFEENFTIGEWLAGNSSTFLGIGVASKSIDKQLHEVEQQEAEYRARIARYQDVCAVRKQPVKTDISVFYYKNPATNISLSCCSVPKAGATFWQRIFQYLNRNSASNVSSPFNLTRFQVHLHPHTKLPAMKNDLDYMSSALRYFFVRDPYARLLSAYVDKFVLPQFLTWDLYGKVFAKRSKAHKPCPEQLVTFGEFIEKVVIPDILKNPHWKPSHIVCDPCKIYPDFIGKLESFSKDVKYIFNKVGLQHLIAKYSYKTYVGDEIKQMVEFTYLFRDSKQHLRKCFSNVEIASRIWTAFQMNGHLPSKEVFPKSNITKMLKTANSTKISINIFVNLLLKENARAHLSRDQIFQQKRETLVREYGKLNRTVMENLANVYDRDFKMFGYDKYPKDLFPWRYK